MERDIPRASETDPVQRQERMRKWSFPMYFSTECVERCEGGQAEMVSGCQDVRGLGGQARDVGCYLEVSWK